MTEEDHEAVVLEYSEVKESGPITVKSLLPDSYAYKTEVNEYDDEVCDYGAGNAALLENEPHLINKMILTLAH